MFLDKLLKRQQNNMKYQRYLYLLSTLQKRIVSNDPWSDDSKKKCTFTSTPLLLNEFLATDFPVLYIYESEIRFGWDTKNKYSAKNSFNKIGVDEKVHCFLESMNHGTQYVVRDLMYYWKWARANSLNIQLLKLTVIKINLSNEIQKFFSE